MPESITRSIVPDLRTDAEVIAEVRSLIDGLAPKEQVRVKALAAVLKKLADDDPVFMMAVASCSVELALGLK